MQVIACTDPPEMTYNVSVDLYLLTQSLTESLTGG